MHVAGHEGGRIGGPKGLEVEEPVERVVMVIGTRRLVPCPEHQVALILTEEFQLREAPRGILHHGFEDVHKMPQHAVHGLPVEEVRAEDEEAVEPPLVLPEVGLQVVTGRCRISLPAADTEAVEVELGIRRVLQREDHLHEGLAVYVALGPELLNDLLEGDVLVGKCLDAAIPGLLEVVDHCRVPLEDAPQGHGVDECADEVLDFTTRAVRQRRADDQVPLPAVPVHEEREGRAERHEEGGPVPAAECFQPVYKVFVDIAGAGACPVALHGGAGPVIGEPEEGWCPFELFFPELELSIEHLAGEPFPLPEGEIGILDRELRQDDLRHRATL